MTPRRSAPRPATAATATLRDYFAIEALPVAREQLLADARHWAETEDEAARSITREKLTREAYRLADAMLAAREGGA